VNNTAALAMPANHNHAVASELAQASPASTPDSSESAPVTRDC
jgi:hypothetical protein